MSKFTSFGSVILLFILLSVLVLFGFYVFAPKVKTYRALNIELEQRSIDLETAEKTFDKQYKILQNLQEKEKNIDLALQKHFNIQQFEMYLQQFFLSITLHKIATTEDAIYQTELIDVQAKIASPMDYYRFIDALNQFAWVVEIDGNQQFKGVDDGIDTHFTLNVITAKTKR